MKHGNKGGTISIHREEQYSPDEPYSDEEKAKLGFDPDAYTFSDFLINLPRFAWAFLRVLIVVALLAAIFAVGIAFGPIWVIAIMSVCIVAIMLFK